MVIDIRIHRNTDAIFTHPLIDTLRKVLAFFSQAIIHLNGDEKREIKNKSILSRCALPPPSPHLMQV